MVVVAVAGGRNGAWFALLREVARGRGGAECRLCGACIHGIACRRIGSYGKGLGVGLGR